MSVENKITEIPTYLTREQIDKHMEEMNNEGYELIHVQEIKRNDTNYDYRMFWRKVEWKQ